MPSPRKRRRPGGSRSARRRRHEQAWLTKKLEERFTRFAELLAEKERDDTDIYNPPYAKEKALDHAAEGSSSVS